MAGYRGMFFLLGLLLLAANVQAEDDTADLEPDTADPELASSRVGSKTDDEVVQREEERINLDGLSVAELKQLREKSEKHQFQAEVSRMMKLIINSLYRNKEIFLRELISNASDALDKLRFLSLTDKSVLDSTDEMSIKIKADEENHLLHIIDTGIGMTKKDLTTNLGTIAKSGTADFFAKLQDSSSSQETSDLIGQFGVGFYSAFLVADKVIVTTKHNDDVQYIWESDASSFNVVEDPRGSTLKRGTQITLVLKPEAFDYVQHDTVQELIKKYSQFINFPIYLWTKKTEFVEEEVEDDEEPSDDEAEEGKPTEDEDDDAQVEEEKEEKKPKTKKVEKTTWDWELMNNNKPIWTRKPADVEQEEYDEFYKSLAKDSNKPMAHTHFIAEGEVSFKSILYIPEKIESDYFNRYNEKRDNIKMFVRRVFITDDFEGMMPSYLGFIKGLVDSDDLPLNVSRENLQQHKLLKVIKKKLVRKALDMIKKMTDEDFEKFWTVYATNVKLGVIEDTANRTRLSKLLRFLSSNDTDKKTSFAEYVERMKDGQDKIYFVTAPNLKEAVESPFAERIIKKGYEVLYLVDPIDEYVVQNLPEFEGKLFQNLAKEGVDIDSGSKAARERKEALVDKFEPLTKWLAGSEVLGSHVSEALVSERLDKSPCALVTAKFGWTGNMIRLNKAQTHARQGSSETEHFTNQKVKMEINPRHPLVKELLARVEDDSEDATAKEIAVTLFDTAAMRSGYALKDPAAFTKTVENMMRKTLGVDEDLDVDEEEELADNEEEEAGEEEADEGEDEESHDEL